VLLQCADTRCADWCRLGVAAGGRGRGGLTAAGHGRPAAEAP